MRQPEGIICEIELEHRRQPDERDETPAFLLSSAPESIEAFTFGAVKPAPPYTTGTIADQNRLKPCRGRLFGLQTELKSERKKKIPVQNICAEQKRQTAGPNESVGAEEAWAKLRKNG